MVEFLCVVFFVVSMAIFLYCYYSYINKKKEELGVEEYNRIKNERKAECDARLRTLNAQSEIRRNNKRISKQRKKEAKSIARSFIIIDILRKK